MSKIKTQKYGVSFSNMFDFTQVKQRNNKITKQKLQHICANSMGSCKPVKETVTLKTAPLWATMQRVLVIP
jgi:hypothetical protein